MKTERNILIAFILNLSFSVFEFIGGIITGSVSIVSDAIHDIGDAASIGISYFLEKISKRQPDDKYTYGYARYSVLGGFITSIILLLGSFVMIYNSIIRIAEPAEIKYNGMIVFAVVGVCINFCAAFFTRHGDSLNQKSVNLHMLEDVLGWAVVLIGAIVMRFTDFALLDPIMSIGVSVFILINAIKYLKEVLELFLEKAPADIEVFEIKKYLLEIDGVEDVHHMHLWSMDTQNHCATIHVVTDNAPHEIKEKVREELKKHGLSHATIEIESGEEFCQLKQCITESCMPFSNTPHHHHHAH